MSRQGRDSQPTWLHGWIQKECCTRASSRCIWQALSLPAVVGLRSRGSQKTEVTHTLPSSSLAHHTRLPPPSYALARPHSQSTSGRIQSSMKRPWYGSKKREGQSAEMDRPFFRPLSVRHVSTSLSTSFLALETDMDGPVPDRLYFCRIRTLFLSEREEKVRDAMRLKTNDATERYRRGRTKGLIKRIGVC